MKPSPKPRRVSRHRFPLLRLAPMALALQLLAGAAHGALFEDDEARRAIIDLRGRVTANQQDVQRRLERLDQLEGSLREIRERIDHNATVQSRAVTDLAIQIEKLGQDLAKLRGEVETLVNELSETQKRQRDFYVDLDARVRKLEPQQQTIDGKAALIDQNESRSFEAALAAFRASEFANAASEFSAFLRRYPNSAYAAQAQYWLGTSHYGLRNYRAAIAAQQELLKTWPDSPRVPDALLNIAASQIDMDDKNGARKTLQIIIDTYPNTPLASNARARLEGMR